LQQKGAGGNTLSERLKTVQGLLEDKAACYVVVRGDDKWVLVVYVPESAMVRDDARAHALSLICIFVLRATLRMLSAFPNRLRSSQVRDKMILASSRSALKEGLGMGHFGSEMFISHKVICPSSQKCLRCPCMVRLTLIAAVVAGGVHARLPQQDKEGREPRQSLCHDFR